MDTVEHGLNAAVMVCRRLIGAARSLASATVESSRLEAALQDVHDAASALSTASTASAAAASERLVAASAALRQPLLDAAAAATELAVKRRAEMRGLVAARAVSYRAMVAGCSRDWVACGAGAMSYVAACSLYYTERLLDAVASSPWCVVPSPSRPAFRNADSCNGRIDDVVKTLPLYNLFLIESRGRGGGSTLSTPLLP